MMIQPVPILMVAACEVGGLVLFTYGLQQWRRGRKRARARARQALTPPMPPPILPAWIFDNSELPDGGAGNWYCPDCWLEWLRDHPQQSYFEPDGVRQFCAAHVTSTLAHALHAQAIQSEKHP